MRWNFAEGVCIVLAIILITFPEDISTQPAPYSISLETALREELFNTNKYEVLQRPTQRVNVNIGFTILTVNDLDIKSQALSISGYLTITWLDSRLGWQNPALTSQDFTSITFLFSVEQYIWKPALVIENSISDIGVIGDKSIPFRIFQPGRIIWNPPGIYVVSCESDITYYPLDTQKCTVKVSSWGYTENEVRLLFDVTEPVDLSFYTENGEWELVEAYGGSSNPIPRGGVTFSSLEFYIKLQRRPIFHIINTLFPVALMAVLIAMVFKLPIDSGEKIGFALTVLLAYAVYLTMIADFIPSTSVSICYLTLYLVFILALAAVSVCLTIFVLSLHFKTEEDEMPEWVKRWTKRCFQRLACVSTKTKICCKGSKVDDVQFLDKKSKPKHSSEESVSTDIETGNDEPELTWQRLALIMDKMFFNIYIVIIILVTLSLFLLIFFHHFTS